jgi:hypothetical protein
VPRVPAVDVVGCDEAGGRKSCATHEICGQHLKVCDVLVFRAKGGAPPIITYKVTWSTWLKPSSCAQAPRHVTSAISLVGCFG